MMSNIERLRDFLKAKKSLESLHQKKKKRQEKRYHINQEPHDDDDDDDDDDDANIDILLMGIHIG